jgi:hypothetical protein
MAFNLNLTRDAPPLVPLCVARATPIPPNDSKDFREIDATAKKIIDTEPVATI